jgi:hypothetical protein
VPRHRALASIVVYALSAGTAVADDVRRVALVNASPELLHAAGTALAPWRIEVIDASADRRLDTTGATAIAQDRGADRIAWLDGDELVVLDPATGISERRPAPDGDADAAAAASVALSLKTALRLAPPPPDAGATTPATEPTTGPTPPAAIATTPARVALVTEVAGGVRFPMDGDLTAHPRIAAGIGVALSRYPRLRPSLVAAFGPSLDDVGTNGLQGSWSDLELGPHLGIALGLAPRWYVVPGVKASVHRVRVEGRLPMQETLDDVAFGAELGVDVAVWFRPGRFTFGAGVGASVWLGLPDYDRQNVTVFDSPTVTSHVLLTALVDL